MYIGKLNQDTSYFPEPLASAIRHLNCTDYSGHEAGKYPIEGERMFAIVQEPFTQSWETGYPEFHARYIDIQLVLEGEEAIGYLPPNSTLCPHEDFLADRDIAFVPQQTRETRIVLTKGMFAVFFPGELHRPCRAVDRGMQIKKVVIKILAK
ncbi:YhcH/YjgK/YiaL family protein [Undibacterium fentianense]|uniref:YhcH/YjgK/YiaL family protein n=1 Tax=Undibacterium fentianense TaxID=2828728 RepID=A0A941E170_9BURK|nr:YhcH/YjgK/YiaL family protein [Undibacterium fentianense]MBR7799372.1 YhcH/YjgK/YiaL family protein [Undibacterium fentianense]